MATDCFVLCVQVQRRTALASAGRHEEFPDLIAVITLGRMGFCARAVLIALVGLFLVQAAVHSEPDNAGGMAKALATLMEQPFGPWLLGATAAGLIAHGLFTWALMRYRDLGGAG